MPQIVQDKARDIAGEPQQKQSLQREEIGIGRKGSDFPSAAQVPESALDLLFYGGQNLQRESADTRNPPKEANSQSTQNPQPSAGVARQDPVEGVEIRTSQLSDLKRELVALLIQRDILARVGDDCTFLSGDESSALVREHQERIDKRYAEYDPKSVEKIRPEIDTVQKQVQLILADLRD